MDDGGSGKGFGDQTQFFVVHRHLIGDKARRGSVFGEAFPVAHGNGRKTFATKPGKPIGIGYHHRQGRVV